MSTKKDKKISVNKLFFSKKTKKKATRHNTTNISLPFGSDSESEPEICSNMSEEFYIKPEKEIMICDSENDDSVVGEDSDSSSSYRT
jgi:hypothetical protein